jgi:hypothetical protein
MARSRDDVLDALDALLAVLDENAAAFDAIRARADEIIDARDAGRSYRDIVSKEKPPLIVELVTANLDRLSRAGSRLRRAEALALYEDGLTMDEIAVIFKVTRQRVSALLKGR